jgi:hypothetical protein
MRVCKAIGFSIFGLAYFYLDFNDTLVLLLRDVMRVDCAFPVFSTATAPTTLLATSSQRRFTHLPIDQQRHIGHQHVSRSLGLDLAIAKGMRLIVYALQKRLSSRSFGLATFVAVSVWPRDRPAPTRFDRYRIDIELPLLQ